MLANFSIADTRNAQFERQGTMAGSCSEVDVAVRQFFRPYVLTFIALAVAFGGSTYGYALCRYLSHSEVTRASLTRAWVDHRDQAPVSVSHEQIPPLKLLRLAVVTTAVLRTAHRSPEVILDEPAPAREAFLFSSLIPFRAPPTTHSSLA